MNIDDSVIKFYVKPIIDRLNVTVTPYYQAQGPFNPMEVRVGLDEKKKLAMSAPPQVIWVPMYDDGYHVADTQPAEGSANYMTWTVCEVTVWGTSLAEAERLRTAVINMGAAQYGGGIAKPYPAKATYSKGVASEEKGVKITFLYGFKVLLISELWPEITISGVNILQPAGPPPTEPPAPPSPPIVPSAGLIVTDGQNPDGTDINPVPFPS